MSRKPGEEKMDEPASAEPRPPEAEAAPAEGERPAAPGEGAADDVRHAADEKPAATAAGSVASAGQDDEPGGESDEPGDESDEPGDESDEPGDESDEPGGESDDEPGDESDEPGGESDDEPGDESDEPGDESDEPGDESDESDEPGDESDEPGDESDDEPDTRPAEGGLAAAPPPNAFLKGAVIGLILVVPLTALAVYALGRLDIGDPQASYYSIIAFVAVFAGLPAIITVGGIGRAAASALVKPGDGDRTSACTRVAAIYTALTTVGLVLLTVVPLGEVPTEVGTWLWIVAIGGVTGALGGFVLGVWIGYGSRKL
jgi:hypothetical protein